MGRKLKYIDLIGKEFGRLTVLEFDSSGKNGKKWKCLCQCGNYIITTASHLNSGHTMSCGRCTKDGIVNYFKIDDYYKGIFSISEEFFYIDADDYSKIKEFTMSVKRYDKTNYIKINTPVKITLHKYIMQTEDKEIVDHIDKDGMNNRKENLRICNKQENSFNHKLSSRNTTGVSGVVEGKRKNSWVSQIMFNGKNIRLGVFNNIEEAIKARLFAEREIFKEFSPQKHLFEEYNI